MNKKKSSIFSTIIKIFLFMTFLDLFLGDFIELFFFGFGVAEWFVGMALGGIVLVGMIALIIGILSGNKDKEKTQRYASVSVNDFLQSLAEIAKDENRLQIDD